MPALLGSRKVILEYAVYKRVLCAIAVWLIFLTVHTAKGIDKHLVYFHGFSSITNQLLVESSITCSSRFAVCIYRERESLHACLAITYLYGLVRIV